MAREKYLAQFGKIGTGDISKLAEEIEKSKQQTAEQSKAEDIKAEESQVLDSLVTPSEETSPTIPSVELSRSSASQEASVLPKSQEDQDVPMKEEESTHPIEAESGAVAADDPPDGGVSKQQEELIGASGLVDAEMADAEAGASDPVRS